jgi:hypothetical protein
MCSLIFLANSESERQCEVPPPNDSTKSNEQAFHLSFLFYATYTGDFAPGSDLRCESTLLTGLLFQIAPSSFVNSMVTVDSHLNSEI